jgi:teichuronic acid biosynthesis glycosyltransferase TuaH
MTTHLTSLVANIRGNMRVLAGLASNLSIYTFGKLIKRIGRRLRPFLPDSVLNFYSEYRKQYPLIDRSQVVLYASAAEFIQYTPRIGVDSYADQPRERKVSLISTVFNEGKNAHQWLDSLLQQSRLPDEIVIADGGSTDGTVEIIERFALSSPVAISVIRSPGANIAQGRNIAIRNASYAIVACTDFGCVLDPDWLRNLILPFEIDPDIQVSAGYYQIEEHTTLDRLISHLFDIDPRSLDPQSFLPSSRSLAMTKEFWDSAGRYPEWLTDAGEDTLFDFHAKSQVSRWAFVPGAKVSWRAPDSMLNLLRTYYRYAVGDGEVGTLSHHYWYKTIEVFETLLRLGILVLVLGLLAAFLGIWGLVIGVVILLALALRFVQQNRRKSAALGLKFYPYTLLFDAIGIVQTLGFTRGVLNRPRVRWRQVAYYQEQLEQIIEKRTHVQGIVVYPPTHDWGFMFQRPHQMARAFARQGYLYFYCTDNEKTDAVIGFKEVEPNLYLCHVPMETFRKLEEPIVYIGSAWRRSALSHFDDPTIIYDHYDDLEVSGAVLEDHRQLVEDASIVLVSSQILLDAVQAGRPKALFTPNGVDYAWIQRNRPHFTEDPPPDLAPIMATGNAIIGYSGALAAWFDYELLSLLANNLPDLEFILVGVDYDGSLRQSGVLEYENVHWLGMKSYEDLFAYVWRFDVGIIPFKINSITRATSPIKLYEYLACKLPVVTTALPEAKKYPGVLIAETAQEFTHHLGTALLMRCDERYRAHADEIARDNAWDARVEKILAGLTNPEP